MHLSFKDKQCQSSALSHQGQAWIPTPHTPNPALWEPGTTAQRRLSCSSFPPPPLLLQPQRNRDVPLAPDNMVRATQPSPHPAQCWRVVPGSSTRTEQPLKGFGAGAKVRPFPPPFKADFCRSACRQKHHGPECQDLRPFFCFPDTMETKAEPSTASPSCTGGNLEIDASLFEPHLIPPATAGCWSDS